jgi:hypothetical protein
VLPKPVPVVITLVPTDPEDTERLDKYGVTVKGTPFDAAELTVTTTFPVEPLEGIVTLIAVALQLLIVKSVPFSVAVEPPCVAPKPVPFIVNVLAMFPEVADRLEIVGAAPVTSNVPMMTPASFEIDCANVAAYVPVLVTVCHSSAMRLFPDGTASSRL